MSIRPEAPARNFTEMSREQIAVALSDEPSYRVDQIYRWVFKRGARALDEMTDLPKALRQRLADDGFTVGRAELNAAVRESIDGTRKLAVRLQDGGVVETVLLEMEPGQYTQCISSQVGCALKCQFCYTGTLGLSRHMTPGEIIDQVILGRKAIPEGARINRIVYMGMGEPLHNFDNVLASLGPICDEDGLGFSHKRVTISTSGLVPQIDKLGELAPVNLAISMNASHDAQRDVLMPINKKYPIRELVAALERYPLPARRKMTIEYVLLGGTNDAAVDARRLANALRRLKRRIRINLLPWNPFAGTEFRRPEDADVITFQNILKGQGFTVMIRTTRGLDIDAACGQLGERPDAG